MRILLTSDNHLGFKENDPIRGEDSFISFEEVLLIGKNKNVDLIIQGGDIFHENKPSRSTLNKTIELIKKHCFGDKTIRISSIQPLNFYDPNINISIPIICIHGNHDDPVRMLSPIDLLHTAGLVNYVGKTENLDLIEIKPVLIENDGIKVAIYSLGYIRDNRLYRAFLQNKISYIVPENKEDYVNILVVHQNRIPHSDKENLPIDFIDPMFDIVMYGHEHESIIFKSEKNGFYVIQTGSTVRTSLCEGESGNKFVYILDIFNNSSLDERIKIESINLKSVRPFFMDFIKVFDSSNVEKILINKVESMIELALNNCNTEESLEMEILRQNSKNMRHFENLNLPLLRLRIELINGEPINKIKFGMLFEKRVANCNEIIHFVRKTKKVDIEIQNVETKLQITDIFKEILKSIELKAIPEIILVEALKRFVDKDDKEVFEELVKTVLENVVKKVESTEESLVEEIQTYVLQSKNEKALEFAKEISGKEENISIENQNFLTKKNFKNLSSVNSKSNFIKNESNSSENENISKRFEKPENKKTQRKNKKTKFSENTNEDPIKPVFKTTLLTAKELFQKQNTPEDSPDSNREDIDLEIEDSISDDLDKYTFTNFL
ncbi:double-strand break repair protein Mre11 [Hamiltosporidium magnivora]|uniref:Double-strand break repair protein n=1 Tax=Hamiltosporidium magnivora TaxID=148818 RepID=A0A4Q9L7S1_9MICR|nr:double-strand break repair protein Mre11 [Hamiltosporidium magnivora]